MIKDEVSKWVRENCKPAQYWVDVWRLTARNFRHHRHIEAGWILRERKHKVLIIGEDELDERRMEFYAKQIKARCGIGTWIPKIDLVHES